ncbi:oligosaccharide flippase family protein [Flammeovirga aprica]|uniref:Oligosaccharide flippase family protein n=1 Tax=Flammeovirga aprica JL-4 TaxID=694437 RepID=A0A7X9RUA8_9BACT|nr:oligosaccharide flippase family protein [Flammeovirga aprica]NME68841.1 oligosaccharide flippase family protein [Flammeovirga aprica JL-4]
MKKLLPFLNKYPFITTYSLTVSELLFGYILLFFITREYSAEDVGLWFIFFSIFNFSINIREGVTYVALVKFSSGKDNQLAYQTYKTVIIAILIIEIVIGALIALVGYLNIFPNISYFLMVYPIFSITNNCLKWVENIHKSRDTLYRAVIINVISLTLLVLGIYYVHLYTLSIQNLVLVIVGVYSLSFLISLSTIPIKSILLSPFDKKTFKEIMHYAKQGTLKALFGTASSKMTLFLSAGIISLKITAMLGLAQRYLVIILSISNAIQLSFYPKIVELYEKGNMEEFKKYFLQTLGKVYLIVLPISIGFLILIKPFIVLLHGDQYSDSFHLLVILVITSLFAPLGAFFASYTNAKGKPQLSTNIVVMNSILLIILSYVMVTYMGEIGTVLPALVTEIIGAVVIFIFYIRYENINLLKIIPLMRLEALTIFYHLRKKLLGNA